MQYFHTINLLDNLLVLMSFQEKSILKLHLFVLIFITCSPGIINNFHPEKSLCLSLLLYPAICFSFSLLPYFGEAHPSEVFSEKYIRDNFLRWRFSENIFILSPHLPDGLTWYRILECQ